MFMDGLIYGSISKNLANNLGTFWSPHFSTTLFNEFYEHPPLALGMEAIFFRIFGEGFLTESLYSLFVFSLTGIVIICIWKEFTGNLSTGWIPLLLWISVQTVIWSVGNNMLENTMSLFVVLSFFLFLKSLKKYRFAYLILAGISLSLGTLTKGFFCLYIWGLPFFIWLIKRESKFLRMLTDTTFIIVATALPIVLLFVFSKNAAHNMSSYFVKQVAGSIENVKTVDSRFAIIGFYLIDIIVPILISAVFVAFSKFKKIDFRVLTKNIKTTIFLLLVSISGVLPIMISMKQRNFYIVSVYPFVALGLGLLLLPIIDELIKRINLSQIKLVILKSISTLGLIIAISLVIFNNGRVGRDKEIISDSKKIIEVIGDNTTIDISPKLYQYYHLMGYFSRHGNISCARDKHTILNYLVALNTEKLPTMNHTQYEIVNTESKVLVLYKRKK
jgi:4-amino-4-deoxy-L-arabinose transferase-like glycosyltransferase